MSTNNTEIGCPSRSASPKLRTSHWSRSEEHTSELQSLMRISYAVFCLKKKKKKTVNTTLHLINITKTKQIYKNIKYKPNNITQITVHHNAKKIKYTMQTHKQEQQ